MVVGLGSIIGSFMIFSIILAGFLLVGPLMFAVGCVIGGLVIISGIAAIIYEAIIGGEP